jgi:hypothetical protein
VYISSLENNGEEDFGFIGDGRRELKSLVFVGAGLGDEKNKSKELTGDERLP